MRSYLDHNATSPLRPEARAAMLSVLDSCGNASSVHAEGRAARAVVDGARRDVALLAGAAPEDVTFTSGGTEAATLVLEGALVASAAAGQRVTRLIVSAVEHDCVLGCAARLAEAMPGLRVSQCPVTPEGVVDLAALGRLLQEGKGRALVSVMAVNNETGVIQPVDAIAALCRAHGSLFHCDGVQAAGRIPLSFASSGIDYFTLSAHKIGGPQGVGALVARSGAPLVSLQKGGAQENGLRAGTENVAGIAGFGAASRAALAALPGLASLHSMREQAEERLRAECPRAVILGGGAPRVATTICVAVPGIKAETMVIALDLDGVAVSAGAACSSGKTTPSHVPLAMGLEPELAASSIRMSMGWSTTDVDIERFVEAWARVVRRAGSRAAA